MTCKWRSVLFLLLLFTVVINILLHVWMGWTYIVQLLRSFCCWLLVLVAIATTYFPHHCNSITYLLTDRFAVYCRHKTVLPELAYITITWYWCSHLLSLRRMWLVRYKFFSIEQYRELAWFGIFCTLYKLLVGWFIWNNLFRQWTIQKWVDVSRSRHMQRKTIKSSVSI